MIRSGAVGRPIGEGEGGLALPRGAQEQRVRWFRQEMLLLKQFVALELLQVCVSPFFFLKREQEQWSITSLFIFRRGPFHDFCFCLLVWGRLCQSKMDAEAREMMIGRKILFVGRQDAYMYIQLYTIYTLMYTVYMPCAVGLSCHTGCKTYKMRQNPRKQRT